MELVYMNGRKVLIQYQDRPEDETDTEREAIFSEYWQAFTHPDKSPKIDGCIGFLLTSLDYFKEQGEKFEWKAVEVFNDVDLDDFQILMINLLSKSDYVVRTGNPAIEEVFQKMYKNNGTKANIAMETIGVKQRRQRVHGQVSTVYFVHNEKRFDSYVIKPETEQIRVFDELDTLL
ncbi:hypothetical protein UN717_10765 [Streptococcus suis]|uniref:hypothetical protein n=1 Tax=Streptococcus suis TaxID=1307 RepID=UPI002AB43541|nr:hypothetical protein [Streptococcus suis]MDY7601368.1 hypothetical protein [Streptococcus suis]